VIASSGVFMYLYLLLLQYFYNLFDSRIKLAYRACKACRQVRDFILHQTFHLSTWEKLKKRRRQVEFFCHVCLSPQRVPSVSRKTPHIDGKKVTIQIFVCCYWIRRFLFPRLTRAVQARDLFYVRPDCACMQYENSNIWLVTSWL